MWVVGDEKLLKDELRGMEIHLDMKNDGGLYFVDRLWVPLTRDLRTLLMDEAHNSMYSVHPGTDKMYYNLRDMFWWPGMKKDVAEFVSRCLTCLQVKAEHQKPFGLLEQPKVPDWKWEYVTMDFITKLPRTRNRHDMIWVIVNRLTKTAHFLTISEKDSIEKLVKQYGKENVTKHGVPVSIILTEILDLILVSGEVYKMLLGQDWT